MWGNTNPVMPRHNPEDLEQPLAVRTSNIEKKLKNRREFRP
jgi:hypothetical protein